MLADERAIRYPGWSLKTFANLDSGQIIMNFHIEWWHKMNFYIDSGQIVIFHLSLDFPEIQGFPFQNATFWGEKNVWGRWFLFDQMDREPKKSETRQPNGGLENLPIFFVAVSGFKKI